MSGTVPLAKLAITIRRGRCGLLAESRLLGPNVRQIAASQQNCDRVVSPWFTTGRSARRRRSISRRDRTGWFSRKRRVGASAKMTGAVAGRPSSVRSKRCSKFISTEVHFRCTAMVGVEKVLFRKCCADHRNRKRSLRPCSIRQFEGRAGNSVTSVSMSWKREWSCHPDWR